MATTYAINETPVLLAPYSQGWRQVQLGTDHAMRPILAGNEEIDLEFDSASVTMSREWLEAASGGSVNLTVLTRYGLGYTDLSSVYLHVTGYPKIESGVCGPFSIVVKGASAA